jgi:hypothetical protein
MTNHLLRPRRTVVAGAVLGLVGVLAAPLTAAAGTRTPVDGVWRTDGYGSIVAIKDGQARNYDTTSISCVAGSTTPQAGPADPDGTVHFAGARTFTVRPARGPDRAVLHLDGSAGDRDLRRLRGLPDACTRPGPTGPLATFDQFWTTYAENYPFFAAKGIDWTAVRDLYRPQVRPDLSDDELFNLLAAMIRPLGDAHTAIRDGEDRLFFGVRPGTTFPSPELEARLRPYIEKRDVKGPLRTFGNERIGYADLPGRIGYLRIIAFAGYTDDGPYAAEEAELDRALDAILTRRRTTGPDALRGLIIDLRINGGGADPLGLKIAARLTSRPYLAYAKHARNDAADPTRFTRLQPLWVRPAQAPIYTGPVAVLTGGSTISAGETFTQALLDRSPRPVRIGENTQGVFSDVLERTLPNGWEFIVPNEEFQTRDGRTFDGTGIPPQVRTPVFTEEEFAKNRDSAFDRAVALLR